MPVEIERKFLVHAARLPTAHLGAGARFAQGYLSQRPTVRVRLATQPGADDRAWLTVKGPGGLQRAEYEYAIPPDHAREMLGLCAVVIDKTRHHIPVGAHVWDVDGFHGRFEGLWLAEVELRAEGEDFVRPPWLAEEVTDDPRYSNAALAQSVGVFVRNGRLHWPT